MLYPATAPLPPRQRWELGKSRARPLLIEQDAAGARTNRPLLSWSHLRLIRFGHRRCWLVFF